MCEGPQPYYWGGTWICGAAGSDNLETIKDVMLKLTCDEAIMKQITMDTQDYTNNEKAMNEIAKSDYKSTSSAARTTSLCLQKLQPRSICPTPARTIRA